MFQRHSLTGRLAMTKLIGFFLGGFLFFLLPALGATYGTMFGLGLWLIYILMSITIGFVGLYTHHPLLGFRMPAWMRGAAIGAGYHLAIILLAYETIQSIVTLPAFAWMGLTSPFWMLLDGAVIGIVIATLTTKYIGEGEMPLE